MRAATAVAAMVAVLVAGCGGGGGDRAGDRPTTPTTAAGASSTTSGSQARAPTASTTTIVASTTTPPTTLLPVPPDAPVVDAEGAVLVAPAAPSLVAVGDRAPCTALAAGSERTCGLVRTASTTLAWVVSNPGTPVPPTAVIYRIAGGRAVAVLALAEDDRAGFVSVHVEAFGGTGAAGREVVVGLRSGGSGAFLEVDVVSGDGTVTAHRSLDHGRAVVGAAGIEDWSARFGPEDPNCCPGAWAHEQLVTRGGRWRVRSSETVATDAVPAGQFP